MTLGEMLDSGSDAAAIIAHVAGLEDGSRLTQCLALAPAQQHALWHLLSPQGGADGDLFAGSETSVFKGRNTLRLFTAFEKWFARLNGGIVGCNRHVLSPVIGPGYFTVRAGTGGGLEFDYRAVPAQPPAGWPPVKPNTGPLARPVYGDLLDRVVWVSRDVLIGAAFRNGAPLESYFVLVRQAADMAHQRGRRQ